MAMTTWKKKIRPQTTSPFHRSWPIGTRVSALARFSHSAQCCGKRVSEEEKISSRDFAAVEIIQI